MRHAWRGAFWSGLLFPGVGQIILKKYVRGVALVLTVLGCFGFLVAKATQRALEILQKIELQDGAIDLDAIVDAVARQTSATDNHLMNVLTVVILLCWLFGIVDAYLIGRKKDREEQKVGHIH